MDLSEKGVYLGKGIQSRNGELHPDRAVDQNWARATSDNIAVAIHRKDSTTLKATDNIEYSIPRMYQSDL